jgi:hypothetical protein
LSQGISWFPSIIKAKSDTVSQLGHKHPHIFSPSSTTTTMGGGGGSNNINNNSNSDKKISHWAKI